MQLSTDEVLIFLIKSMLKDLSIDEAQDVISIPSQLAITLPYLASFCFYRCTVFLMETFPTLEFNYCTFFNQTPSLLYTPLMEKLFKRGLNPFIPPQLLAADCRYFNWYLFEYAFDAHHELKDCKIQEKVFDKS